MNKIIKIIAEEIQSFVEGSYDAQGVADKAYEKFHIYPDDKNIRTLGAMQKQVEEPYGYVEKIPVFMNPKSLRNFDADVRAISVESGDLFVMQKNANIYHGGFGTSIKLAKNSDRIYNDYADFLLLNRVGVTNTFGLSDTSAAIIRINKYATADIEILLDAVRRKNPQYKFEPVYFERLK